MTGEGAIAIRVAEDADVDRVLRFWRDAGADPSATDDASALEAAIGHPTSAVLMAFRGATLVGTTIAACDGWRGALYRVIVAPEARRTGVAGAMVREAERRLRAFGCRRISILVLRSEPAAERFWRAAGFEPDERLERFAKPLDPSDR